MSKTATIISMLVMSGLAFASGFCFGKASELKKESEILDDVEVQLRGLIEAVLR